MSAGITPSPLSTRRPPLPEYAHPPIYAATLGVVVLGERLTVPAIIGIALLLAGLLVLTIRNNPQPVNASS